MSEPLRPVRAEAARRLRFFLGEIVNRTEQSEVMDLFERSALAALDALVADLERAEGALAEALRQIDEMWSDETVTRLRGELADARVELERVTRERAVPGDLPKTPEQMEWIRDRFKPDGLLRLARATADYYEKKGSYLPDVAALAYAEWSRAEAAEARVADLEARLRPKDDLLRRLSEWEREIAKARADLEARLRRAGEATP